MIDYTSHQDEQSLAKAAWLRRNGKRQRNRAKQVEGNTLFEAITERDSLYRCYQESKESRGQTAGSDGYVYDVISNKHVGSIMDAVEKLLRSSKYVPQPTRTKRIPKAGGKGNRELHIPTIIDRAVSRSLANELTAHFEKVFLERSWGFRPNRSALHMLAYIHAETQQSDSWVISIADIRKAFDTFPIKYVLEAHNKLLEQHFKEEVEREDRKRIWNLVRTILQGSDQERRIGIDQGNPYSPLALNVLLHYVHDVPLSEGVCFPPWHRYADNLTYLSQSVSDGRQVLDRVRRLLSRYSLRLRNDADVHDLSAGDSAQLMGFALHKRQGRLALTIGDHAWDTLRERLRNAHATTNPAIAAKQIVSGWVSSWGLAIEKAKPVLERVLHTAATYGFRETCSRKELKRLAQSSRLRWRRLCDAASRGYALCAPPHRISGT